jgi:hypothetical protein
MKAMPTILAMQVDGKLDEDIWTKAEIATLFTENSPDPGDGLSQRSEVKMVYDQEAVYIGAMLYDTAPDSILRQLTNRDQFGNSDFFAVYFDCYQDGVNGLSFGVTAAGVQIDRKFSQNDVDRNWNAVWWSKVRITDEGWVVEMKIPYAALRFPDREEQIWNVNFQRNIRRTREQGHWSPVDPAISGIFNQAGQITGIRGIKPPLRLFFFPYATTYLDNNESLDVGWQEAFQGGMDVKYGISDAFTLDMTLIPDFGQVQSDNLVLNLSPFEVFFNEQRQFFTEGTELFNKANLFYSRRIGGTPLHYFDVEDQLGPQEEIISNPNTSRVINSTKVSGRNAAGTGIGVFNSVTSETYAEVEDTETGAKRRVLTDPLTNYNVFVIDQVLRQNSYVSLVNTNVYRSGSDYEANVTGTEYRLTDKKNLFHIFGTASLSQKYEKEDQEFGFQSYTELEKISGTWTYGLNHTYESPEYDRNDLGFLQNANENTFQSFLSYNSFKPSKYFNEYNIQWNTRYSRIVSPEAFQDFGTGLESIFTTIGFHTFSLYAWLEPVETYDYFEPRAPGRFYAYPTNRWVGGWISSDYRRRFALDGGFDFRKWDQKGRDLVFLRIAPRFRFNDRLSTVLSYSHRNLDSDQGWVNAVDEGIIIGTRDLDTYETIWTVDYVFTDLMGLIFRLRHNWTRVNYLRYEVLDEDGYLQAAEYDGMDEDGLSEHNTNFNAFNIDMVYTWVFSPGSELRFVWKNSILGADEQLLYDHRDNIQRTFELDQVNSLSLRLSYFLDYRTLTGKVKQPEWGS